jgi:hypothetical protein
VDRRTFLRCAAGLGGALGLGAILPGCDRPSPSVTVHAVGPGPSVLNPFLSGSQATVADLDTAANVFYPSRTEGGPILDDLGPYPLVGVLPRQLHG